MRRSRRRGREGKRSGRGRGAKYNREW